MRPYSVSVENRDSNRLIAFVKAATDESHYKMQRIAGIVTHSWNSFDGEVGMTVVIVGVEESE